MDPALSQSVAVLWQVAMGIGLAACAGLRAFVPLLVAGVAGRLDWISIAEPFRWLESWPALTVFGVAVATEVLADKVPAVDHVLDAVQGFVKPVAGTVLAAAVLADLSPLTAAVLGLIVGGTVAGGVHLAKAKLRVLSSVTTAGLGNPVLSLVEDATAAVGSVGSVVAPFVVAALVVALVVAAWAGLRGIRAATSGTRRA